MMKFRSGLRLQGVERHVLAVVLTVPEEERVGGRYYRDQAHERKKTLWRED
jgi:hypothetical protein